VDNPLRTAAYLERMASRRDELAAKLAALLPATTPAAAKFVWEVGCGHGHFLTAFAAAHPERLCLGIDLASERIERATRKQVRAKLANLHFLQADARLFLETMPTTARIGEVFILFPDPWPKSRHHKHRILQPDFLTEVARRAVPGAPLHFRTDHAPYFADAARTLAAHEAWTVTEEPWPFEVETVFQSRAEGYQSLVARCTGMRAS